jgi:class 3 adenylate cyclase/tetratricopeptide (TPR) repeat protein
MVECTSCGARSADEARFCASCGARLSSASPASAADRRKTVTAVFTDLVGSTALASQLDPEALRALMSRYYEAMRAPVERHGGRVDKFIGDAVVAFFGVPVAHEDDALRAVRAAAGMHAALVELNEDLDRRFGVTVQIRTGVNTGDVLASAASRPDSFTVGDAVNVAARLEQHAGPGEVLLGEATYQLVRDSAHAMPVAPLVVKGKEAPLTAFRLAEVAEFAPSSPRRLDSPLVGRDDEVRLVLEAFERAKRQSACHLFTILGTAGAGKSRLTAEVVATLEGRATVMHGRCLSYGEGITYWPLVEMLRGAAGIVDGDDAEVTTAKLAKLAEGEDDADLIATRLARVAGAAPGVAPSDEIFWAVRKLFAATARRRPLVVVVDDIHWAEPTLLDLLDHVAEWTRDAPMLLLCIARPELLEGRPDWAGGKRNATTIHLEPLSEQATEVLLGNLLGGTPLPVDVRDRITAAAEGIPLFVEEMVGMLRDSGRIRPADGAWVADDDLADMDVPPTIRALLTARLDGLPGDERQILEAAAVVGKEFWRGAVEVLAPAELRPRVGSLLRELLRKDLVLPERSGARGTTGDDGFRFRHILIRDAAYDAIPKAARADLHERFAEWLHDLYVGRTAEVEEILGYHLQEAHRNRLAIGLADEATNALAERASAHLVAAGRRALGRNDYRGALNLLERAYSLAGAPSAELLLPYGSALAHSGSLGRALELIRRAVVVADREGDERLAWHARIEEMMWRALVETGAGIAAEVLGLVPNALPVFERLGDDVGAALAWQAIAGAHSHLGQHALSLEAAERAVEHGERAGDDSLVHAAFRFVGVAAIWGPMPFAEAERRYGHLLERAQGGPLRRAAPLELMAALKLQQGDVVEGRALIARAKQLYDELGDRLLGARAALIDHRGPMGEGDFATTEAILRDACEVLAAAGESSWYSTAVAVQASALFELGRLDEAYEATIRSEAAGAADDVVTQSYWRAARAKVLAGWGRADEALALADEAVRLIDPTDGLLERGDVYASAGETNRLLGRANEARDAFRKAIESYEAKGAVPMAELTRASLARVGGS